MAILDQLATFIRNAAIDTQAPGTKNVGKVWDIRKNKDLANLSGRVEIRVTQDATSGGAATLGYELVTSDSADLSSPTVLWTSPVVALADLKAGKLHSSFAFPEAAYKQYLGLCQITGTAAFTGGKVDASYAHEPRAYRAFKLNV